MNHQLSLMHPGDSRTMKHRYCDTGDGMTYLTYHPAQEEVIQLTENEEDD